jgi:hypothetical protein
MTHCVAIKMIPENIITVMGNKILRKVGYKKYLYPVISPFL